MDAELLSRLAGLELRVRHVVEGTAAGLHRSPQRGSSVVFAEHKEYAPGDDLRRLDWKAFAKFDRYYIRQYEDENELRVYLLLDSSGSMAYGAPLSKHDYGAVLMGALAQLLRRQRDLVGLLTFSADVDELIPAAGGDAHARALMQALVESRPRGQTRLKNAVRKLLERGARRGLVIVVSDFFDIEDEDFKALSELVARRHRVLAMQLLHPDELGFPFSQVTIFEAMESNQQLLCDPAGLRETYLERLEQFRLKLKRNCEQSGIAFRPVSTADALDHVLVQLLRGGPI
jgi:uncharacterized protein (DUF58 family)